MLKNLSIISDKRQLKSFRFPVHLPRVLHHGCGETIFARNGT
ncbi:hypothetical protein BN1221_04252c [Brenneria goodwinii]|uniref:Uncharacterized protein n=1 Tax=Brenneria goodwinii TaxID=1109412 RepID=A0A0G4K1E7_9GAMM|nr:hypothetical protein BN1221_04252c [Brenneria goodwinii]